MIQTGLISQIHPYVCGLRSGDITKSQKKDVCGQPEIAHTEGLFEHLPSKKNAPVDWDEMMKEVYATHPDYAVKSDKKKKGKKDDDRTLAMDNVGLEGNSSRLSANSNLDLGLEGFEWIVDEQIEKEISKHRDAGWLFAVQTDFDNVF